MDAKTPFHLSTPNLVSVVTQVVNLADKTPTVAQLPPPQIPPPRRIQFECGCFECDWTPRNTHICRTLWKIILLTALETGVIYKIATTQQRVNACNQLKGRDEFLCIRDGVGLEYGFWFSALFTIPILVLAYINRTPRPNPKYQCLDCSLSCNMSGKIRCSQVWSSIGFVVSIWLCVFCATLSRVNGDAFLPHERGGLIFGSVAFAITSLLSLIYIFECAYVPT